MTLRVFLTLGSAAMALLTSIPRYFVTPAFPIKKPPGQKRRAPTPTPLWLVLLSPNPTPLFRFYDGKVNFSGGVAILLFFGSGGWEKEVE